RQGLSRREVLPRRQAAHDWRGHERDPAAGDRSTAPGAVTGDVPQDPASPAQALSARVLAGDARAIARAISLIEDEAAAGAELVRRIFPHTGRASCLGVTGPPGAGKSTLVDRLTAA